MPLQIYRYDYKKKKRSYKWLIYLLIFLAVLIGIILLFKLLFTTSSTSDQLSREASSTSVVDDLNLDLPTPEVSPVWPESIQSSVGAIGYGVLAESDVNAQPVPMASLAKVMAAILIMETDGVSHSNPGRDIEFSLEDEAFYNYYLYEGAVVTTVKAGSTISQLEALKAMLISSSNNLADTAVIATFGSMDGYLEAANAKANELGLKQTVFADDASGYSPNSTSTASDLLLLGEYAMNNPLFAEIVSTWKTTILGDIELTSTNVFLDFENNGVIGMKSGLTDQAGGTYVSAAHYKTINGDDIVALTVTLGAKTHFQAQEVAMPLLLSVKNGFNSQ